MAGQDAAVELDVEPLARERVVDRVADEMRLALPQLDELLDVGLEHVVAEHAVEIADQVRLVVRLEQGERLAVDLEHANALASTPSRASDRPPDTRAGP